VTDNIIINLCSSSSCTNRYNENQQ